MKSNFWYESNPEITLDDMILTEDTRSQVVNLRDEQHRSQELHEYNLRARNMVIIEGGPGSGKSMLAEAIASELMYPMIRLRYENIIGANFGETLRRLREALDYAKTGRFVLLLDPFEILTKTPEDSLVLFTMLDEMPDNVVIIAVVCESRNYPNRHARRRIQVNIFLPSPTYEQKIEYIASIGRRCCVNFLSPEIKEWDDSSFSDIEQMCIDSIRRMRLSSPGK